MKGRCEQEWEIFDLGYCVGKYLEEKGLNFTATLDVKSACSVVDFVVRVESANVYSTNRIDVALSKRTRFAHYIGH